MTERPVELFGKEIPFGVSSLFFIPLLNDSPYLVYCRTAEPNKDKNSFYFFKEPFSCPLSFRRSSKKDQFAKRILIRMPVSLPHHKNRLFKPFSIPSSFPAFIFSHIIVSEFCLLYGAENNIISFSVSASFLLTSVRRPPDSLRDPYISPLPHGFLLRLLISSVDTVRRVPNIKGVRK